jgi:hypothetical protein
MLFKEIIAVDNEKRSETHKYQMKSYWLLKKVWHTVTIAAWRVDTDFGIFLCVSVNHESLQPRLFVHFPCWGLPIETYFIQLC